MQLPLISVIVPVYNVKSFLVSCLTSVKNQTYKNLEIILVDDGSTDGSSELIKKYAKIDSRVKIIKQKNSGLSSARNAGISASKGKYLFFLDSDDSIKPDAIEYLYKLSDSTKSPISICSHLEKKEKSKLKNFNSNNYKTEKLSVEAAIDRMLNEQGFMISAWGKLFDAKLFRSKGASKQIRFPENMLHEDVGTTYKLFLRAFELNQNAKVAFGSRAEYIYNIRNTSITNQGFNNKKLELIIQTDKMCDDIEQVFPSLKNTTNLRRVHARFSILRQIIQKTHKTENDKKLETSLINYIKEHKNWIIKNPKSTKRDKLALISLELGKPLFKLSWAIYSIFFK